MHPSARELCERVAKAIVAKDWKALRAECAPWLAADPSDAALEEAYEQALGGLAHPPATWSADEGAVGFDELREPSPYGPPSRAFSPKITAGNFRAWLCVQFVPDVSVHEEQNVCFDVWLAAIEDAGAWRVGYLEFAEPS